MTKMEYEELISYRNRCNHEQRIAFKDSELSRMAYHNVNPLSVMIHLDNLKLFWY